ncbi:unnamed protein product, partial [Medioppia subpectinata]
MVYNRNYFIHLCHSIDVIMDEKSGLQERNTANQYMDSFKSNQNVFILFDVSLRLLNQTTDELNTKSVVYKVFGLQTLEVVIKFHWNSIDDSLKQQIKQLIQNWFLVDLSSDEVVVKEWRHMMNGLSRCVVEVVIREWPQNWPQFIPHLLQKESTLSLYCIWQLSEDIGIFFRPNNGQRRREITNELNNNLNEIYSYIYKCMDSPDTDLCLTAICTLNVMFEWTQLDENLLNALMQRLAADYHHNKCIQMKQSICDCLLVCLNRKQLKPNDKIAIQTLHNNYNISIIVSIVGSLQTNLLPLIAHKISRQEISKNSLGFEFDDNEDFESFFLKFRADTIELLRQMTFVWEILAQLSAAFFAESDTLLRLLIDKTLMRDNPNVISSQLSCISALTVFLPHISDYSLKHIIERTLVLSSFTIDGQETKSKDVKNLRRHACSLFIKICQTY